MIQHIYTHFAGLPFKLNQLKECASGSLCGADLLAHIPEMLQTGQLASIKKAWGERLYYVPAEGIPRIWDEMKPFTPAVQQTSMVMLQTAAKTGLAYDIFRTLTWISRHGLKLTSKGTIHQRTLNKLTELLYLSDEDVAGLGLRYPHQNVYRASLAIVLDMMMSLGFINKERAGWGINTDAVAAWLSLSIHEMNAVLFREMLHRYVPEQVDIQHFVYRLALSDLEEGQWYSFPDLLLSMQEQGMMTEAVPEEQKSWMIGWLTALGGFGWLDIGNIAGSDNEGIAFRWQVKPNISLDELPVSSSVPSQGIIFVQPDFEILVPPDVSFMIRWELEAFCESVTVDTMSVYRMSRSSVALGMECGRSPRHIMDFLQACSTGIPDHVALALEQWDKEMGRTVLEEHLLLRCSDSQAADQIASHSALMGYVERIGPLDFIVNHEHEDKVLKLLEELRLLPPKRRKSESEEVAYPRLEAVLSADGIHRFSGRSEQQAWIFNGKDIQFYNRDASIPEYEALFPGLREVPSIWVKGMRLYHDSTARQMVEQAIEWNAKIRLSMNGTTLECIPEALQEGDGWRLRGRLFRPAADIDSKLKKSIDPMQKGEEVVLSPDEWQEMMLILPEMRKVHSK